MPRATLRNFAGRLGDLKRAARAGSGGGGGIAKRNNFEDGRRRLRHRYMKESTADVFLVSHLASKASEVTSCHARERRGYLA